MAIAKTNEFSQSIKCHLYNLGSNIWFVISACCFYLSLYARDEIRKRAILLAVIAVIIVALFKPKMKDIVLKSDKYILLLSFMCILGNNNYYEGLRGVLLESSRFSSLCSYMMFAPSLLASTIVFFAWAGSIPFFLTVFCYLYQWIMENIVTDLKKEWGKADLFIMISALVVILLLIILLFNTSSCFYTTVVSYDVLYTADSPVFISQDVWTNLFHGENDYRQPLFAIAAAPFFSPIFLIKRIVPGTFYFMTVLVCLIHAVLMIIAGYLTSTIIINKQKNRWLFVGLYMSMYSSMLFIVMIEQFTVATFWVLVLVYCVCKRKKNSELPWMCATGALTTSIVLIPFICFRNEDWANIVKQICTVIKNGVKYSLSYLCVVCMFVKYDAIKRFMDTIKTPSFVSPDKYARMIQFINFPYTCFLEPQSEVIDYRGHMAWYMKSVNNVNVFSVMIIVIALSGGLIFLCETKNNRTVQERILGAFVVMWILFSAFVLGIYGWGTGEGALVLYSLYFGWAYYLGVFLFVKRLLQNMVNENMILICGETLTVLFFFINLRSLWNMASSLAPFYPLI